MKLNFKMPFGLKAYYKLELSLAQEAITATQITLAWYHLERAHIIGQRYPIQHTETHWKMLLLGFRTRNMKEIVGQTCRLLLGAPFSFIDKIPLGNVGSTRVLIIQSQVVPSDIEQMFLKLKE